MLILHAIINAAVTLIAIQVRPFYWINKSDHCGICMFVMLVNTCKMSK
jgi:hypothetical protein